MSLYNSLFGMNKNTSAILKLIGLNINFFARFRDVDLINNGETVRVFTRTGGNNREYYQDIWEEIRKDSNYITDYDDDFDCTYAYIEFKVPENKLIEAKSMFIGEPESFENKFNKALEEVDNPNSKTYELGKQLVKQIEDKIKSGENGVITI